MLHTKFLLAPFCSILKEFNCRVIKQSIQNILYTSHCPLSCHENSTIRWIFYEQIPRLYYLKKGIRRQGMLLSHNPPIHRVHNHQALRKKKKHISSILCLMWINELWGVNVFIAMDGLQSAWRGQNICYSIRSEFLPLSLKSRVHSSKQNL